MTLLVDIIKLSEGFEETLPQKQPLTLYVHQDHWVAFLNRLMSQVDPFGWALKRPAPTDYPKSAQVNGISVEQITNMYPKNDAFLYCGDYLIGVVFWKGGYSPLWNMYHIQQGYVRRPN